MSSVITPVRDDALKSVESGPSKGSRSHSADRFYRPELDVLRFFAFFAVFMYHVMPKSALAPMQFQGFRSLVPYTLAAVKNTGVFGVCLFFLLSAYLITELLHKESERTQTIHIPSFYMRRILRIWPLYFGFVFAMAVVGHMVPSFRLEPGRIAAFALLAGNWYVAKFGYGALPVVPLWSISVEEQFYLVWPSVARFGGRKGLTIFSALIFPLSWFAIYRLTATHAVPDSIWVNSFVQFQFFALGALLAVSLKGRTLNLGTAARVSMFFGGLLVWVFAQGVFQFHADGVNPRPGSAVMGFAFAAAGCGLIFCSVLGAQPVGKMKSLVYLGKISYGLYVYHYLCIVIARSFMHLFVTRGAASSPTGNLAYKLQGVGIILIALVLTVILSSLSYNFFERPFLKLKEKFTVIQSRTA